MSATGRSSSATRSGDEDHVPSPCISVCVMDADGVLCTGCFRPLDEIAAWGMLDADAKRRILAALPAREASRRTR